MVQLIKEWKMYHVTKGKSPLTVGQSITTGRSYNDYFQYYLNIKPFDLPLDEPYLLYRELVWEQIRATEFVGLLQLPFPSRQKCLFGVTSLSSARSFSEVVDNGIICELTCRGIIHEADERFIPRVDDKKDWTLPDMMERARSYWGGQRTANPNIEVLFCGSAIVTGYLQ